MILKNKIIIKKGERKEDLEGADWLSKLFSLHCERENVITHRLHYPFYIIIIINIIIIIIINITSSS